MIITGDCLQVMKTLDASSIDAIVTDPPYGLSFMGKDWDKGVPGEAFWREALRVAKPGCHLLAAGGTRTFHRLAVAIEDAGWEIRDCVMWIYGSGFPKSHNVSKAIDKAAGAEREVVGQAKRTGKDAGTYGAMAGDNLITAPTTDAAKKWQGWGTALKPAWEPFILARKPLDGTVAANVLAHGTGAVNIDGCRVGTDEDRRRNAAGGDNGLSGSNTFKIRERRAEDQAQTQGRWPANVIHDGSDTIDFMGKSARFFYCAKASKADRDEGCEGMQAARRGAMVGNVNDGDFLTGSGNPRQAVGRNHHPTVKPTALMQYLCKLITPPDGTILDPFCGSGSTGVAAIREGFNFIGIELNPEYAEIATRRIEHERNRMPLLEAIR